jgi:hypothetical protein
VIWRGETSVGIKRRSEKGFMAAVIAFAKLHRWKVYHTHDSRRSEAGFLDLVLVRERVLFAELKDEKGHVSDAQADWIAALLGAGASVFVWRPGDWDQIERVLGGQGCDS